MAGREDLLIANALSQPSQPQPPQEYHVTMPDGQVLPATVAQVMLLGQISDQLGELVAAIPVFNQIADGIDSLLETVPRDDEIEISYE